jgi:WD40 repeat protein
VQALSVAFAPVAFSPDGQTLATASRKETDENHPMFQVVVWNVSDGAVVAAWDTEKEVRYSLSFSPDGQVLIGHAADSPPLCWTMTDLNPAPPMKPTPFRFVPPISPDQKTCALPGPPGDIVLWDLSQGKMRSALAVKDLAWTDGTVEFSPDSQTLAVGYAAMEYDDWLGRISNGMLPGSRRGPFVPPSQGVKLVDVETGRVFATFQGTHSGTFSPDGKSWAMRGTDGTIQIWDVPAPRGNWPIVLWLCLGLLITVAITTWWWLRRLKKKDRVDSISIQDGLIAERSSTVSH